MVVMFFAAVIKFSQVGFPGWTGHLALKSGLFGLANLPPTLASKNGGVLRLSPGVGDALLSSGVAPEGRAGEWPVMLKRVSYLL